MELLYVIYVTFQLEEKIEKMENKMAKVEELNAQLQEKLLTAIPSTIKSEKFRENKGVLKVLSKRLAVKLSDDGVSIFFRNKFSNTEFIYCDNTIYVSKRIINFGII